MDTTMKDHVQSCHLAKFDAFGVNRDKVINLERWFQIHTNVCYVEAASSKPYKFLKCVFSFLTTYCRILSFGHHLKEVVIKTTYVCTFLRVSEIRKKKLRVYDSGGRCLNIAYVCTVLNHVSKSNLVDQSQF